MRKVTIESDGRIMAGTNEIGLIPDFKYTDFSKFNNMANHFKATLHSKEKVEITYGGYQNGKFIETCHSRCSLGRHCFRYAKFNCQYNPDIKDVGFYIL